MASAVEIIVSAKDEASAALGKISDKVGKLGSSITSFIGGAAKAGFAALAAGIAGATVAIAGFIKEAAAAELIQAKFNSVMDASALAGYKEEALKLADAMSQITRFDDEAIMAAEAQIALYDNIGQDIFPQVIAMSLDLAEALGVDAASGAETLGRALADIAEGSLSMLARSKLITKEQQEMAEAMAAAGDEAGAQAYILGILDGKIGDLAETMGKTWSGQLAILGTNIGNLKESIGSLFTEALQPLLVVFNDLVTKYGPVIVAWFETKIIPAVKNLVAVISDLLSGKTSLKDMFGNVDWGSALADAGNAITEWAGGLWESVTAAMTDIDFGAIGDNLTALISGIDWNAAGQSVATGLQNIVTTLINFVTQIDWGALFASIGTAFADFAAGLVGQNQNLFEGWGQMFATIGDIIDKVIAILKMKVAEFIKIGMSIVKGLQTGIEKMWTSFVVWLTEKIKQIIDTVLNTLGIHSPSRVFAGIGKNIMAGLAVGIGDGIQIPVRALQESIPQLTSVMGAGRGSQTQNHYYYGARIMLEQGHEGQILASLTV